MPKISKILLLAASVVLVLTVFLGVNSPGVNAASESQDGAYKQINVYSEVLQHIQSDYVTQPDMTAVTNGALRGLLRVCWSAIAAACCAPNRFPICCCASVRHPVCCCTSVATVH